MTRRDKLIYLAGVIDSDGFFTLYKVQKSWMRNPVYNCNMGISQVEIQAVTMAYELFGGNLRYQDFANYKRHSSRPVWQWTVSGDGMVSTIKQVAQYLQIKKERAILCLELRENIDTNRKYNPLPDEVVAVREAIYLRYKSLSHAVAETNFDGQLKAVCDSPICKDDKLAESGGNDLTVQ